MGKRLDARYLFRRRGATGSKTRIEAYRGAGESVSFTGSTKQSLLLLLYLVKAM